ncbi:hypothetical protein ScPMuIL_016827 [Solemya velum]
MVLVLIQIVAEATTAAGHKLSPNQCKEEYDKCVKKQVYPEHECTFSMWHCLLKYCHQHAQIRSTKHTYIARLFACASRHKLPVMMMELL